MKIMINFLASTGGGALSYLRNILPLLAKEFNENPEHQLFVLSSTEQQRQYQDVAPGIEFVAIDNPPSGVKRVLWEMTSLNQLVKDHDIDVFFTPYQLAPNVKGAKTITMIRNMEPFHFKNYRYSWKTYLRNLILSYTCPKTLTRSDKVIAVSEYAKEHCTDVIGMSENDITLIYHGRDTTFSPLEKPDDSDVLSGLSIKGDYIFTCGSLLPYRRCEKIIEAFSEWAGDKDCQLVIAGSGNDINYRAQLDSLMDSSPVKEKINFLGQVTPDQMRTLYRNCKLFVTATEIEACPNIGIEAMSSGCNILSSDNKPLPEIFKDAAMFFSTTDKQLLVKQLDELYRIADKPNEKALSRAEDFCWEKCAAQTFNALTQW